MVFLLFNDLRITDHESRFTVSTHYALPARRSLLTCKALAQAVGAGGRYLSSVIPVSGTKDGCAMHHAGGTWWGKIVLGDSDIEKFEIEIKPVPPPG